MVEVHQSVSAYSEICFFLLIHLKHTQNYFCITEEKGLEKSNEGWLLETSCDVCCPRRHRQDTFQMAMIWVRNGSVDGGFVRPISQAAVLTNIYGEEKKICWRTWAKPLGKTTQNVKDVFIEDLLEEREETTPDKKVQQVFELVLWACWVRTDEGTKCRNML